MNPRQMKQMMRQMGMSQDDVDAVEVIIKTPTETYVFENPNVQKISMKGEETFQIVGDYKKKEAKVEVKISSEDIKMVSEQANVSDVDAKIALEETKGDIAEAIVKLTE